MVVKRPIGRLRAALPAVAFAIVLGVLAYAPRHSGNVWSRYMTIESIVERGTLAIGDSPLLEASGSPDLALFREHFYSDKPPVLSALGALVYLPMERSGLRMAEMGASFLLVNLALVVSLVAMPSAVALYALRRMFQAIDIHRCAADLLTIGFGFGSMLYVYGVTFNNHSPAAGLLTAAFAGVLLGPSSGRSGLVRSGLVGLMAGLAATIDLPAGGTLWLALLIWIAARSRRAALAFAIGSAPPALLHCGLQTLVTGTPLPVEFYPEALAFEGSYWATEEGRFVDEQPRIWFLIELLIGPQGWLTMTPALIFAPVGLAMAMIRRRDEVGAGAIVVSAASLVLLGFYSFGVRRTDFAGASYGTRHLLAISPLVFFYAGAALERLRAGAWRLIFAALMAIGIAYATMGMLRPWTRAERRSEVVVLLLQRFVLYPYSSYDR